MSMETKYRCALLTGGNGNLGRLVAAALIERDVKVVKFDQPSTSMEETHSNELIVSGDIRDSDRLAEVIRAHKPDIIYHFASLLSGSSEVDLEVAWGVNATASLQLLQLAVEHNVSSFFFASTAATYGPNLEDPLPPAAEQWPETMYGVTKVAVERLGSYFKNKYGLDFRCLRFPLVVSPFAPKTAVTAYPSHAFKAAIAGDHFTFPVSPSTGMSSIFLEDVIDGIVQFTAADADRLTRPAYNLHAFHFPARAVEKQIRRRTNHFTCDYQPVPGVEALLGGWPDIIDDSHAREDWGWAPRFDFESACEKMFQLLKEV